MNERAFEKTSDPSLQGIKPNDWAVQSVMFCPVVCFLFFFLREPESNRTDGRQAARQRVKLNVIKTLKKNKALIL